MDLQVLFRSVFSVSNAFHAEADFLLACFFCSVI
jgi:hypothetical protein